MNIHTHAARGDIAAVIAELARGIAVDVRDDEGCTALMVAAQNPEADVEILEFLIARGANVNAVRSRKKRRNAPLDDAGRASLEQLGVDTSIYDKAEDIYDRHSVLSYAVRGATYDQVAVLLGAGADVYYVSDHGYSVLISAMYRTDFGSENHQAILHALIDRGAPLDIVTKYGESALGVASQRGEFSIVFHLLEHGADPTPLGWTPLFFEVARENLAGVAKLVDEGADLEQRDARERTPFLLSVHAGNLEIAEFLLERGSDPSAKGRCGQTALMVAISRHDATMLQWLIDLGWDVEEPDEFGDFPLNLAAQGGSLDCVKVLLDAGASAARRDPYDHSVIRAAHSPEIVHLLAVAGEDLCEVGSEMRRILVGTEAEVGFELSREDYQASKHRVFGADNPERMNNPLWDMMIRTRMDAFHCANQFGDTYYDREPVWCFARFGHTFTQLPDGCYVEIGGEHEDHYDPDFCIYNDIVVHHGGGTFDIFGYPEDVFPPTDFHSATLVWPYIYIVGCLGYPEQRRPGETPVFRLHCETWAIEPVECTGDMPGWIYDHKAVLVQGRKIQISGGQIVDESTAELVKNTKPFVLDLDSLSWRRE